MSIKMEEFPIETIYKGFFENSVGIIEDSQGSYYIATDRIVKKLKYDLDTNSYEIYNYIDRFKEQLSSKNYISGIIGIKILSDKESFILYSHVDVYKVSNIIDNVENKKIERIIRTRGSYIFSNNSLLLKDLDINRVKLLDIDENDNIYMIVELAYMPKEKCIIRVDTRNGDSKILKINIPDTHVCTSLKVIGSKIYYTIIEYLINQNNMITDRKLVIMDLEKEYLKEITEIPIKENLYMISDVDNLCLIATGKDNDSIYIMEYIPDTNSYIFTPYIGCQCGNKDSHLVDYPITSKNIHLHDVEQLCIDKDNNILFVEHNKLKKIVRCPPNSSVKSAIY